MHVKKITQVVTDAHGKVISDSIIWGSDESKAAKDAGGGLKELMRVTVKLPGGGQVDSIIWGS